MAKRPSEEASHFDQASKRAKQTEGSQDSSNGGKGSQEQAPPTTGNQLPPLPSLTKWLASEIPEQLPPLPPISDPRLAKAALTHSGCTKARGDISYENLEFLGDAFIYHVASEFISQTFPDLSPGRCSQARERLLRNTNLAEYSREYGLQKQANFPAEYFSDNRGPNRTKAGDKEHVKVLGDLFEAYVGALIRCDGEEGRLQTIGWLKALWSRTLAKDIRQAERGNAELSHDRPTAATAGAQPQPIQGEWRPKEELSKIIGCRPVKIRYEDLPGRQRVHSDHKLPLFNVGCYVDAWGKTELLASGSGLSKKDAGAKAAEEAMKNKRAMQFLTGKKKEYLAAQEENDAVF